MRPISKADRIAMKALTREWRRLPTCFSPNDRAKDLIARGLIEFDSVDGWPCGRLTDLGAALIDVAGEG
jgi:hypothetical protein